MPAFFFSTDEYIYGTVMANYTSGAPVRGNLTLKATIRPIKPFEPKTFTATRDRNPNEPTGYYQDQNQNNNNFNDQWPITEKYLHFVSLKTTFQQTSYILSPLGRKNSLLVSTEKLLRPHPTFKIRKFHPNRLFLKHHQHLFFIVLRCIQLQIPNE